MVGNWHFVTLSLAAIGLAGFSVGILYRAGVLITLTALTAVFGVVLGYHQGFAVWQIAVYAYGLLVVLQLGYLIGACFPVMLNRDGRDWIALRLIAVLFKPRRAP